MLWIFLSILAGLGDATIYAFMKRLRGMNGVFVVWIQYLVSFPVLLALLYFFFPENINNNVYYFAITNGILVVITALLLFKAFKSADLSVTVPLLSFTPLFLLLTSFIMVNETPSSLFGYVGVVLIVMGTYVLNLSKKKGFFEPIKLLFNNPGSMSVLGAAFLMSIMANFFKIGIQNSNPVFFTALIHVVIIALLLPYVVIKTKSLFKQIKSNYRNLIILGFASGFMQLMASYAVMLTIVPFMISLKRSSVLFGIGYGYFMFKEKNIKGRLLGASIMLIGALMIILL